MQKRIEELSGSFITTVRSSFDANAFDGIIRSLLGIEQENLPEEIALSELGLDSIFATELR